LDKHTALVSTRAFFNLITKIIKMKKLLILLLFFSSCIICKKQTTRHYMKKTSAANGVTYTYDSTIWKIVPMSKEDSLRFDSLINLNPNK
jgi:hypothetical protein